MPRIFSGVIRALSNIYQYPDSQKAAPGEIELDLPIQVVHDVSRIATPGAALGERSGFWVGGATHAHVATGNLTSTPSPYDNTGTTASSTYPTAPDPLEWGAWIYSAWIETNDQVDWNYGTLGINQGIDNLGPAGAGVPIAIQNIVYWNARVNDYPIENSATAGRFARPIPLLTRIPVSGTGRPFLRFLTNADTAGTVTNDMNYLFWMGKRGTLPPGF